MWPSVSNQKNQVVRDLGQQFFFHNIGQQEIGQFDNRKSYCFMHPGMKGKMKMCLRNIKEYRLLLHLYKINRFSTKKFKDMTAPDRCFYLNQASLKMYRASPKRGKTTRSQTATDVVMVIA